MRKTIPATNTMSRTDSPTLWIVHREASVRAALARIAGAGDNTVLGAPGDDLFASASPADVVLLAPTGDFESELEFVHRFGSKPPASAWILLLEASDMAEARRLFDNLPAQFLRFPPQPESMRRSIASATRRRSADSLSRRRGRDLLADRFKRWFIDLELPDLLRSLDPRLGDLPLLIRGEPGTGRGIVARYVHAFGSADFARLLHVPCQDLRHEREVLEFIRETDTEAGDWRRTVWLEGVDHLPMSTQLRVRDWIEYGLPEGVLRATQVRFIASADDVQAEGDREGPRLHAGLATALSGLAVELPTLRERVDCIEAFVADSAFGWADGRGERHRSFGQHAMRELSNYPWPGNMAQLEAVVFRSLSHSSAAPLEPHHLRFEGETVPVPEEALPAAQFVDDEEETSTLDPAPMRETPLSSSPDPRQGAFVASEPPVALGTPAASGTPAQLPDAQPESASDAPQTPSGEDPSIRRLVSAVAHEVRNPLTSIRTFSELLPDHYADEDFRNRFAQLVGDDVLRIEQVVACLEELSEIGTAQREVVELSALLESILERNADAISNRHLLVLKELDRNQSHVLADRRQLERAFVGIFDTALSMVPERGDVYLASKHNSQGHEGRPVVRVLLRYHNPDTGRPLSDILFEEGTNVEGITPTETSLEYLISEVIVRAQGGQMTLDTTDAQETVIVVDLPAANQFE